MTASPTEWLPDLFDLDVYDLDDPTDLERCLDALLGVFRVDFVDASPTLIALPVRHYTGPGCGDGRGEAFWHLTTKEAVGSGSLRERDWDRCRRIRWPRPVIDAVAIPRDLRFWRTTGARQKRRLKIAFADFSYVVILEERRAEAILITAFPVVFKNYRDDLRKEWTGGRIVLAPPSGAGPRA